VKGTFTTELPNMPGTRKKRPDESGRCAGLTARATHFFRVSEMQHLWGKRRGQWLAKHRRQKTAGVTEKRSAVALVFLCRAYSAAPGEKYAALGWTDRATVGPRAWPLPLVAAPLAARH
jgi:hypothetical protein